MLTTTKFERAALVWSTKLLDEAGMSNFPNDPRKRRSVIVLEQHDIDKLKMNGDTAIFAEPHTCVLSSSGEAGQFSNALSNIVNSGLDQPGLILVQSPFDPDEYVAAEEASERFMLDKQMLFLNFCQILGAKRVSVSQLVVTDGEKATTVKFDGTGQVVAAGGQVDAKVSERLAARISLGDEFDGGPADLAKAEQFLQKHRLYGDRMMRSLLDARSEGNAIRKRVITVDLSNEARHSLSVVARLKLPAVELIFDFNKVKSERKTCELQMEVDF